MTRANDLEAVVRDALTEFFADAASRGRADDGIYGRREAAMDALAELVRLADDAERLRDALEVIVGMGDYTYKPHEFAVIARAALEASA